MDIERLTGGGSTDAHMDNLLTVEKSYAARHVPSNPLAPVFPGNGVQRKQINTALILA